MPFDHVLVASLVVDLGATPAQASLGEDWQRLFDSASAAKKTGDYKKAEVLASQLSGVAYELGTQPKACLSGTN